MSVQSFIRSKIQQKQPGQLAVLAGLILWAVLLTGVFFSTQPTTGLYVDNQSTYFVQGLRLSGRHPYLEADWFAQTKPLHIAFTFLVAGLERWGVLPEAMAVTDALFRLVFLASLGLMANAWLSRVEPEAKGDPLRRAGLVLGVISIYVLSLWPVFQLSAFFERIGISSLAIVFEKFGFYYSLGGFAAFRYYTEPASFSLLILTALALTPYNRWRWSAALLGIAGLMHASYLIHSGILAGLMVAFLWFTGRRNDAFWAAGLYAVLVLPLVVYIATQLTDPYTSAANQLLAMERVPHHTQPDRWWDTTDAFHVGVIGLAAALIWWKDRGFSRIAVLATTFYVGIGVAAVVLTNNPNLAILMPWRASGYLYTIAQLAVLTAGLLFLIKVLGRWPRFATSLVIFVPLVLLLWGTVENGLFSVLESEYADTTTQPQYPFMLQIQQNTPENAVLLTPLRDGDYRLGAQRAVYVDWKSHPYKGTQVLDWWERVEFVREFYSMDAPNRRQACRDAEADFYVLGVENLGEPEQPAISWEALALVPCPLP